MAEWLSGLGTRLQSVVTGVRISLQPLNIKNNLMKIFEKSSSNIFKCQKFVLYLYCQINQMVL